MARIVRFHEFGGPEVLRIEDVELGHPGPGEVLMRVEAIGLNRAEAGFRAGRYLERPQFPARIGYEASGVIEELGEGVTGLAQGAPINVVPGFSMNRYGVYGDHAIVPALAIVPRLPGLDAVRAAAVWMAYASAYGGLIDVAGIAAGDRVIITAASSSVGLAAIQIANLAGAVPIATTRTGEKRAALLEAGAAHVIATAEQDVVAEVADFTGGEGARIVFDPVGGAGIANLAQAMTTRGIMILYGNLSGKADSMVFPWRTAIAKGLSLRAYLVFEIIGNPERFERCRTYIARGVAHGGLAPMIDRTFPLEQIVEAHRFLESNQQFGKIVVTVAPL